MKVGRQFKPGEDVPTGTPLVKFWGGEFIHAYVTGGFTVEAGRATWYLWEDYEPVKEPKPRREPRRGEIWRARGVGGMAHVRIYDGANRKTIDPDDMTRCAPGRCYRWIECLYSPYDDEGENNES